MATHSSILAQEILWTEGAWQATVRGVTKELNTTSWLNNNKTSPDCKDYVWHMGDTE